MSTLMQGSTRSHGKRGYAWILAAVLALLLVTSVCWPLLVPSLAYGHQETGRYWAGQYTCQAPNGTTTPYFGYKGVKGRITWTSLPVLAGGGGSRVCSWLNTSDAKWNWTQCGLVSTPWGNYAYFENGGPYYNSTYRVYREPLYDDSGLYALEYCQSFSSPGSTAFTISYYGPDSCSPPHYYWMGQFAGNTFYGWEQSYVGLMQASSETINDGAVNGLATTYFGSDRAGYDGSSYALYLLASSGWYLWGSSLPAGATRIGVPPTGYRFDPHYHYSPGYNYYYFGTWNS